MKIALIGLNGAGKSANISLIKKIQIIKCMISCG